MTSEPAAAAGDPAAPETKKTPARRWWLQKEAWQNFGAAVILIGLLPLMPLIIELMAQRQITEDSLIINAAVYSATIALLSANRLYFAALLAASILESALYGFAVVSTKTTLVMSHVLGIPISSSSSAMAANSAILVVLLILAFLCLLAERFFRHVRNHEEYFEFLKIRGG